MVSMLAAVCPGTEAEFNVSPSNSASTTFQVHQPNLSEISMASGTSSTLHRGERSSAGLALTILLPLLGVAGCATQQERVSQKEDTLAAAGFIVRPANTPERQAMLNRLPAHHFVQRARRHRELRLCRPAGVPLPVRRLAAGIRSVQAECPTAETRR